MAISRIMHENIGNGSWIRRMSDEAGKLKAQGRTVFDLTLGNPDLPPPPAFKKLLLEIAQGDQQGIHGYMNNGGYPDVRAAIAKRISKEQNIEIPGSNVIMSVGAAGGLNVSFKSILNPGDEVIAIAPYFSEYTFYVQNSGGTLVPVKAGAGFSPDLEAIEAALSPRTAAVIVNSPNNPTGRIYSRSDLEGLAALLEKHGKKTGRFPYIVSDEPYRAIVYGGAQVPSIMDLYPETIVVSSWSKSLSLAGERIGCVAVSPRCSDAAELVTSCVVATRILGFVNAPALMQRVVAGLLNETADIASYEHRGRILSEGLKDGGYEFPEPEGAFYIFAKVPEPGPESRNDFNLEKGRTIDVDYCMALKDNQVIAVPGVGFGYPGYFRISYCVSEATIRGSLPGFKKTAEEWRGGGAHAAGRCGMAAL